MSKKNIACYNVTAKTLNVVAGTGNELRKDGEGCVASFVQPTAVVIEGDTLYVCDTAVGSLRMVTPTQGLVDYLSHLHLLCDSFTLLGKGQAVEHISLTQGILNVELLSSFLT